MASTLRSLTVWFRARTGDFKRKVMGARTSMQGFSKTAQSMQSSLSRLRNLLIGGIGFALFARGIRSATEAWNRYERAAAKINTSLKVTGGSVGFTRKELIAMARDIRSTTGIASSSIMDTMAVVGSFVDITGERFERLIRLLPDVANLFEGDMSKAAIQLGKALQDPHRGLAAIRRIGVTMSETEVATIRSFHAMGQAAEGMNLTLKLVEEQGIKGMAEAFRKTGAGAIMELTTQWGEFKKEIGQGVQPVLVTLGETLAALLPTGESVGKGLVAVFEAVALAVAKFIRMIQISIAGMKILFAAAIGGLAAIAKVIELISRQESLVSVKTRSGASVGAGGGGGGAAGGGFGFGSFLFGGGAAKGAGAGQSAIEALGISARLKALRMKLIADANVDFDKIMFGENAVDKVKAFFRRARQLMEQFRKEREKDSPIFTGSRFFRSRLKRAEESLKQLVAEGKSITTQLQTPLEKFEERMGKLGDLMAKDIITWEIYGRGIRKAREELDKTFDKQKSVKKFQLAAAVEVGADFRGHAAAFRQANPMLTVAKQNLKANEATRTAADQIARNLTLTQPKVVNIP